MEKEDKFDNQKVRRQDRLLSAERSSELLRESEYGFMAVAGADPSDGDSYSAYSVPLNHVWDGESLWFHSATAGEKLERIARDNSVSYCVVGATKVDSARFTTAYESVMVFGKAEIVEDVQQRMRALAMLLDKYSPMDKEVGMKYAEKSAHRTTIIRVRVERMTGKAKAAMPAMSSMPQME